MVWPLKESLLGKRGGGLPAALGYLLYAGGVLMQTNCCSAGKFSVTIGVVLSKGQPVERDQSLAGEVPDQPNLGVCHNVLAAQTCFAVTVLVEGRLQLGLA